MSITLGNIGMKQEAVAKDFAAVTDAKSCAAAVGRMAESMDQWLAAVPAMESANDPDGTLATSANKVGKAMGSNYRTALKVSEAFKDDPEVSALLKKLEAQHEELMK